MAIKRVGKVRVCQSAPLLFRRHSWRPFVVEEVNSGEFYLWFFSQHVFLCSSVLVAPRTRFHHQKYFLSWRLTNSGSRTGHNSAFCPKANYYLRCVFRFYSNSLKNRVFAFKVNASSNHKQHELFCFINVRALLTCTIFLMYDNVKVWGCHKRITKGMIANDILWIR
jgi:hypothetical protein